jgi:hypothetical protein
MPDEQDNLEEEARVVEIQRTKTHVELLQEFYMSTGAPQYSIKQRLSSHTLRVKGQWKSKIWRTMSSSCPNIDLCAGVQSTCQGGMILITELNLPSQGIAGFTPEH